MKHVHIVSIIFLIFLLIIPITAETIVKPAYDLPVRGEKHDPTPISYWQLPLWIILLEFVQAPLEIFTTFRGLSYLGYRAITDNNVLSNDTRLKIHDYVEKNPGVSFSVISKETGVNRGTLSYHLIILESHDKIKVYKNRGYKIYFENYMKFNDDERRILQYLKKDTSRKIIENLIEYRGKIYQMLLESRARLSHSKWNTCKQMALLKWRKRGNSISIILAQKQDK